MSRHGMKGPHGGMRGGAKAKDFKGSLKKLVKYMSVYKVQMLLSLFSQDAERDLTLSDRKY